ncbi:hypothetical protein D3OALGB2SA_3776 [Olavius algarvensis associated proteobacterium Delta 3]|nr:hypothetical protein D3OALGB2SA_3776 [Olavius algarvensis associated proteobacterium Delta 3]
MPNRKEISKIVFIGAVLVVVVIFAVIMNERQGAGSLTIKTGESELVMNFADNKLNFSELISLLLNNKAYRRDTLAILRDSYGLYQKDSDLLVDHIRRESGESSFSQRLREVLVDLRGPFERQFHHYYDITQNEVVDAINSLDYKHEVARRLRELRDSAAGIFEQRGVDVDVALYSSDKILDGNAAVCEGSKYRGRDLLLLNPYDQTKTISVFARNSFKCIKLSNGAGLEKPLIQINHNDARRLFGDILFSAKHEAVLYPVQSGYSIDPKLVGIPSNETHS